MEDLEERQREMRQRNSALSKNKKSITPKNPPRQFDEDSSDVRVLRIQISQLEKRLLALEAENQLLRKQKTVIVDRPPERSTEDSVREQRHNFFKYSNVRRY